MFNERETLGSCNLSLVFFAPVFNACYVLIFSIFAYVNFNSLRYFWKYFYRRTSAHKRVLALCDLGYTNLWWEESQKHNPMTTTGLFVTSIMLFLTYFLTINKKDIYICFLNTRKMQQFWSNLKNTTLKYNSRYNCAWKRSMHAVPHMLNDSKHSCIRTCAQKLCS